MELFWTIMWQHTHNRNVQCLRHFDRRGVIGRDAWCEEPPLAESHAQRIHSRTFQYTDPVSPAPFVIDQSQPRNPWSPLDHGWRSHFGDLLPELRGDGVLNGRIEQRYWTAVFPYWKNNNTALNIFPSAIITTKMSNCVVEGCHNRAGELGLSFYRFPVDPERRKRWIAAVNRGVWSPSDHSRLCSAHFISGKNLEWSST